MDTWILLGNLTEVGFAGRTKARIRRFLRSGRGPPASAEQQGKRWRFHERGCGCLREVLASGVRALRIAFLKDRKAKIHFKPHIPSNEDTQGG